MCGTCMQHVRQALLYAALNATIVTVCQNSGGSRTHDWIRMIEPNPALVASLRILTGLNVHVNIGNRLLGPRLEALTGTWHR